MALEIVQFTDRPSPNGFNAQQHDARMTAVRSNLNVLDHLGITNVIHSSCPECGLSNFADAEHASHVCGYCGYGPWISNLQVMTR